MGILGGGISGGRNNVQLRMTNIPEILDIINIDDQIIGQCDTASVVRHSCVGEN